MNEQTKRDLERISGAAREDALKSIYSNWGAIVQKLADEAAEKKSVQHAKFLADWAGFSGAEPVAAETKPAKKEDAKKQSEKNEEDEDGPSLVQILLDTLLEMKRGEWRPAHLDED